MYCALEFNQSQWVKEYVKFKAHKLIQAEKNVDKDGIVLHKLMKNAVYGKTTENLRNTNNVEFVNNKKAIQNGHPNQAICYPTYLPMIQSLYVKTKLH